MTHTCQTIVVRTNGFAYAAIRDNGAVHSFGLARCGGDSSRVRDQLRAGATMLECTRWAFAAVVDGRLVAWGHAKCGGSLSSDAAAAEKVHYVVPNAGAFAAVTQDNRCVVWGAETCGGLLRSGDVITSVFSVVATDRAFCALHMDGNLSKWGHIDDGGTTEFRSNSEKVSSRVCRVKCNAVMVAASRRAFVALEKTGRLLVWGHRHCGGSAPRDVLTQCYVRVRGGDCGFAGITATGSVMTWGGYGATRIPAATPFMKHMPLDVHALLWGVIVSFADTPVSLAWSAFESTYMHCASPETSLNCDAPHIVAAVANATSAVLVYSDHSILTVGGQARAEVTIRAQAVVRGRAAKVVCNNRAFAVLCTDGAVYAWGDKYYGGYLTDIEMERLQKHNCKDIVALYFGFVAIPASDAAMFEWGRGLALHAQYF